MKNPDLLDRLLADAAQYPRRRRSAAILQGAIDTARHLFESLLVCLVVLKLAGLVTWHWVWILAPLWCPVLLAVVVVGGTWLELERARRARRRKVRS